MANYTIQRSLAAAGDITVTEATVNTDTNVSLVGQNFTGYGDEIATNFLQMLENYAADSPPNTNPRVPGSTAITGQLWYDTANAVLKVYSGTSWNEQAQVNQGTVEDAVLRWNDSNGRYQEEERVRVSDVGVLAIDSDGTGTNFVSLSHDGISFSITGSGTHGQTRLDGGNVEVRSGNELRVYASGNTESLEFLHDGTDAIIRTVATTDLDITGSLTNLRVDATLAIEGRIGAPADVVGYGQVWVNNTGSPAELYYTDDTGQDVQITNNGALVSSGGGGNVSNTGTPVNNQVAVWTSATVIEGVAGFTWDGTNLSATQFGGIAEANLLDKSATETISGAYTFSNASPINATGGDISATGGNGFVSSDGAVGIGIRAESGGNTIDFTHSNTPAWDITGLLLVTADCPIYGSDQGGSVQGGINVIGDNSTWTTSDSKIAFYDSDQTDTGMLIGTSAGSSVSFVNSRLGQLNLLASNTQVANFQSSLATFTSGGVTSLELRNSLTSSNSTSAAVTDNSGNLHNVGYNETPLADDTGANIDAGSFTLSNISIGKFISRTTSISRTLTLDTDANMAVGATVLVHNGSASGTFTIAAGTAGLEWIDGSGSAPSTGSRTLANNSVATIRKKNASTFQIWGNGIS